MLLLVSVIFHRPSLSSLDYIYYMKINSSFFALATRLLKMNRLCSVFKRRQVYIFIFIFNKYMVHHEYNFNNIYIHLSKSIRYQDTSSFTLGCRRSGHSCTLSLYNYNDILIIYRMSKKFWCSRITWIRTAKCYMQISRNIARLSTRGLKFDLQVNLKAQLLYFTIL